MIHIYVHERSQKYLPIKNLILKGSPHAAKIVRFWETIYHQFHSASWHGERQAGRE